MTNRRSRALLLTLMIAVAACSQRDSAEEDPARAVVQLYQDYRLAWLRNDASTPEAVLSLFAADASLLPHRGDPIISGRDAIAAHWFPEGQLIGRIELFDVAVVESEISGDLGYVYGRFELDYSFDGTTSRTAGNELLVARRDDGVWRIVALIWSDAPAR